MESQYPKIIPTLILYPYATPLPGNSVIKRKPNESTTDEVSNSFQAPQLLAMLNRLEDLNDYFKLQCEKGAQLPEVGKYGVNPPLFMEHLCNNSINLLQLASPQNLQSVDQNDFFRSIYEQKACAPRIIWGLQMRSRDSDSINKIGIISLIINERDVLRFKVFRSALDAHLIQPDEFIREKLFLNATPDNFDLFINEILSSSENFMSIVIGQYKEKFVQKFYNQIIEHQTLLTLFQVTILTNNNKDFFKIAEEFVPMIAAGSKKRINEMCSVLNRTRLSFEGELHSILCSFFPFDKNIKPLVQKLKHLLMFSPQEKIEEIIITLCSSVFWFDESSVGLSVAIVQVILMFKVDFPEYEYFCLLEKNIDKIHCARDLSAELQYQKQFKYKSFLSYLENSNHGLYKYADYDLIRTLLYETPVYSRSTDILAKIIQIINHIDPEANYDHTLQEIMQDPTSKSSLAEQLPYLFVFIIALYFYDHHSENENAQDIILDLNVPILYSHLVSNKDQPIKTKHINKLKAVYPILKFAKVFKNQANKQFQQILEANEEDFDLRAIAINIPVAKKFFFEHRYLCSMFTLDAFLGVKTQSDFLGVFKVFLNELFNFEGADEEDIFCFLSEFVNSACITKPLSIMQYTFFECLLNSTFEGRPWDHIKQVLNPLFKLMFQHKMLTPQSFLSNLNNWERKEADDILINIFFSLLNEKPHIFSIHQFADKEFFDKFMQYNSSLLPQLVMMLREYPQPTANESLEKALAGTPGSFQSFIFSLLPDEIRNRFDSAFEFFSENVSWENVTVWSLWLQKMVFYNRDGILLEPITPSETALNSHYFNIVRVFQMVLRNQNDPRRELLLRSWKIVCNDRMIGNRALSLFGSDSPLPEDVDFILSAMNDSNSDAILNWVHGNIDPSSARLWASILMMHVSLKRMRNMPQTKIVYLIECLARMEESCSVDLFFVIDAINYIARYTITRAENDVWKAILDLPEEIRKHILIMPPIQYPSDPMFKNILITNDDSKNIVSNGPPVDADLFAQDYEFFDDW